MDLSIPFDSTTVNALDVHRSSLTVSVIFLTLKFRMNATKYDQAIGVTPDERGLLDVDDSYQTAQSGVYACGDVIGYPALASTSMEQGVRAAHHMWNDAVRCAMLMCHPFVRSFHDLVSWHRCYRSGAGGLIDQKYSS